MRDRPVIYAGLVLFLGFATLPFWWNLAGAANAKGPKLVLPAGQKECVAPVEYMRISHMRLLVDWREEVVRGNQWQFTAFNGKTYDKSLTSTCLAQCHTNKEQFCDSCHAYAGVSGPYCWDCHTNARQIARSMP
jgi:hypothetical protein